MIGARHTSTKIIPNHILECIYTKKSLVMEETDDEGVVSSNPGAI